MVNPNLNWNDVAHEDAVGRVVADSCQAETAVLGRQWNPTMRIRVWMPMSDEERSLIVKQRQEVGDLAVEERTIGLESATAVHFYVNEPHKVGVVLVHMHVVP